MWDFDSGDGDSDTWTAVSTPVNDTLYDVVGTANGPCAVGAGGTVVGRTPDGSWGVVVENGPAARSETLYAVDTTDGGQRVWFTGSGGAVGYYDLASNRRFDRSQPEGMNVTFHALTVSGVRGSEKLLLADGNGVVLPGVQKSDGIDWGLQTKPADGNAITALASDDDEYGYGVDGNANVWQTTGEGWEHIGIDGAKSSLYAAAADGSIVTVGGGNGCVYERVDGGEWTPYSVGEKAIECLVIDRETRLAGGESGLLSYRERDTWRDAGWDGTATLHGILVGSPSVAVGGNGVVLERTDK